MSYIKIDQNAYLRFSAVAEKDGKLYIADACNRGLIEYDLEDKMASIKNVFLDGDMWNNYWNAFAYEDEIWFIPSRVYIKIAIYNIARNEISYLEYPQSEYSCPYIPFEDFHIINNTVYLVPSYYDAMLKIDLQSKEVMKIDIDIKKFAGRGTRIFCGSCINEGKIYMCPYNHNMLYVYDTCANSYKVIYTSIKEKKYSNIFVCGAYLVLLPLYLDEAILFIDFTGKLKRRLLLGNVEEKACYYCSVIKEDYAYFFPNEGRKIVKLNMRSEQMSFVDMAVDRLLYFYRQRWMNSGDIIICSENSTTPALFLKEGNFSVLDIKLADDYFITELLMEIEERKNVECNNVSV